MKLPKVEMKIVVTNNSNDGLSFELFDEKKKLPDGITCEIITKMFDLEYKQSYYDFLNNISYESLIIENVKSNNPRLNIFIKDTLQGRKPVDINSVMPLFSRSVWVIDVLPNHDFVIDFTVVAQEVRLKEYNNVQ